MTRVQHAVTRPFRCAFIPYLGNSNAKGFFDSGTDFWGERVYASVEAVEHMAGQLGWVGPQVVHGLERDAQRQRERAVTAERELEACHKELEAADLLADGFTLRRKPGRPKKEEAVA